LPIGFAQESSQDLTIVLGARGGTWKESDKQSGEETYRTHSELSLIRVFTAASYQELIPHTVEVHALADFVIKDMVRAGVSASLDKFVGLAAGLRHQIKSVLTSRLPKCILACLTACMPDPFDIIAFTARIHATQALSLWPAV
jgi:hypothetical protein